MEIKLELELISLQKHVIGNFLKSIEGLIPSMSNQHDYETLIALSNNDSEDPFDMVKLFNKL